MLRECLALGLQRAAQTFAQSASSGFEVELHRVATSTIGDVDSDFFAAGAGALTSDVIAGVVQRFDGQLSGTALFALDPSDALLWLQLGDEEGERLERFVARGRQLISEVLGALAAGCDARVELGTSVLEERPLLAALLSTHAPSDTTVLSLEGKLRFRVGAEELHAPFSLQILVEPKLLDAILAALLAETDRQG